MLDQMFTAENFRRIFENENRKGSNLAGKFFPSLDPHTKAIRIKSAEIKAIRSQKKTLTQQAFSAKIDPLRAELKSLKSNKSRQVLMELEQVSQKARKPSFRLSLAQKPGPKGKDVFCIDGSPETFFVVKQLQHNIRRIYDVKQSSRHDLACRLRDTVACKFPFEVVRTDVSSFYESIDRHRLLERLEGDQLLSSSSKKFIRQVLHSYEYVTGSTSGIPRGVGISAYLAEFYMRPIDWEIKAIPGMILYCRYVDDIAVVFARPHEGAPVGAYDATIATILSNHGLTQNTKKTKAFALGGPQSHDFEYLGYRFVLAQGRCSIESSLGKILKYEKRINMTFDEYDLQSSISSRRAYRDIVSRIKFLTGNARLMNSKSDAVTGIYYNNSMLTDTSSLAQLDKLLKKRITAIKRQNLKNRLEKYTFTDGFLERRFHNFSSQELQRIARVWTHA